MLTIIIALWVVIKVAQAYAIATKQYQPREKPPYTLWGESLYDVRKGDHWL
jgi:hypothetical protein